MLGSKHCDGALWWKRRLWSETTGPHWLNFRVVLTEFFHWNVSWFLWFHLLLVEVGPAAWSSWSWPLMLLNDTIDMHTQRNIHYPCLKKSGKRCLLPSPPPPTQLTCMHACTHTHTNQQTILAPSPEEEYSTAFLCVCSVPILWAVR